ncbi:DUF5946 family protein [Agriterribacter humi]|jgi:hypothetical protein|uniref:DUF5946 family protein n=1 Tax=Agriterribacter humi TaxID=1104781 RepID=UPI001265806D|nr:DUF5946 family protein [Agriterribacter humi]
MQNLEDYAKKNGIVLQGEGPCQFCGAPVARGVFECHSNLHHIAAILDFNDPSCYLTRFLSVDAMALQHCELHGPWNNHIHLARLFLIFEKNIAWDYAKTPLLSNIINQYKKNKTAFLMPPPLQQRGRITTSDLLNAYNSEDCKEIVKQWAKEVYDSFGMHHSLISSIAGVFIRKYYS